MQQAAATCSKLQHQVQKIEKCPNFFALFFQIFSMLALDAAASFSELQPASASFSQQHQPVFSKVHVFCMHIFCSKSKHTHARAIIVFDLSFFSIIAQKLFLAPYLCHRKVLLSQTGRSGTQVSDELLHVLREGG